jgi:hypothetical protein
MMLMKPFIALNQLIRSVVIVSIGICLFSCNYMNGHTISGSGHVVKQDRKVSSFTRLDISVPLDVTLIPSNQNRVVVEIDDNLQSYVTVVPDGSLLSISVQNNTGFSTKVKGKIEVYFDSLTALSNHSVGILTMQDTLHTTHFELDNHAVGKTYLQLDAKVVVVNNHSVGGLNLCLIADSLSLQNHAVGETILSGRCNDAVMNNQSVGNFDAKQFHCQEIHLTNSAVGNASITADKAFYVTNSGVGHLILYGKGIIKELQDNGITKTQRDNN